MKIKEEWGPLIAVEVLPTSSQTSRVTHSCLRLFFDMEAKLLVCGGHWPPVPCPVALPEAAVCRQLSQGTCPAVHAPASPLYLQSEWNVSLTFFLHSSWYSCDVSEVKTKLGANYDLPISSRWMLFLLQETWMLRRGREGWWKGCLGSSHHPLEVLTTWLQWGPSGPSTFLNRASLSLGGLPGPWQSLPMSIYIIEGSFHPKEQGKASGSF